MASGNNRLSIRFFDKVQRNSLGERRRKKYIRQKLGRCKAYARLLQERTDDRERRRLKKLAQGRK